MPKHDWVDFYQEAMFSCSLCDWHWNKAGGFYYLLNNVMARYGKEPPCTPNLKHLAKAYKERKNGQV